MSEMSGYLAERRMDQADALLYNIEKMRQELNTMEAAARKARAGEPMIQSELRPNHQTLAEIQEDAAKLVTLWETVGLLERS